MYQPPTRVYLAWVPTSGGNIPPNAVVGGRDNSSREDVYIGRFQHNNDYIPGKALRSHKCTYVPYGGKEIPSSNYEILVSDDQSILKWIPESGGSYCYLQLFSQNTFWKRQIPKRFCFTSRVAMEAVSQFGHELPLTTLFSIEDSTDFHIFPRTYLRARRGFEDYDELTGAIESWLEDQAVGFYQTGIND